LASIVFYVYVGVIKMSIALFNIRLTTLTTPLWKYVNWAFFVVCTAYTFVALFLNLFKCNPQYASFSLLQIAEAGEVPRCLSVNTMNSILRLNLALDFTALAIPVIVIWKVQLSWKKKARIFGLLSIGLIACIASVMTLISQYTLEKDPLWNYTTLLAWIMVEIVISLFAACAPTLAYFLPHSMVSRQYASNTASKVTGHKPATGFGSRLSRIDCTPRANRNGGEDEEGEEEEYRIIVKDDIKMDWRVRRRSNAAGSGASHQSSNDGGRTSWYGDDGAKSRVVVYDGRPHDESTRAWVATDTAGRNAVV
jgi:hypothetical protein